MPSYQGHLIGGTATFLLISYVSSSLGHPNTCPQETAFAFGWCILGSLFPDIDTKSLGQRIFYSILTIMILYTIVTHQWTALSILSLLTLFPILVNHRGVIHNFWFIMLVPLIIPLIITLQSPALTTPSWLAYGYFTAGALSHLILDFGIWQSIKKIFHSIFS